VKGIKADAFDCELVVDHDYAVGLFNQRKVMEAMHYWEEPEEESPALPQQKPRARRNEQKIKELENYIGLLKAEIVRLAALVKEK